MKFKRNKAKRKKDGKNANNDNPNLNEIKKKRNKQILQKKESIKKSQSHQSQIPNGYSSDLNSPILQINQQSGSVLKWYDNYEKFNDRLENESAIDPQILNKVNQIAQQLLMRDVELFSQWYRSHNRSESNWLDIVQNSGTYADRISAIQLRIQKSPVHSLDQLNGLINTIEKKGIRESHSVLKVLKEIFLNEFLPQNRKLIPFRQRPLLKFLPTISKLEGIQIADLKIPFEMKKRLTIWIFESELKLCYQQFIKALEGLAGNNVEGVAQSACQNLADLLIERAEQEQEILTALVNKLGHPNHKIGSKVALLLEQLAQKHPNMRPIIVAEIECFIFRKNVALKAQHYAVHFLSRLMLNAGEIELALRLVRIYLNLFRVIVLKKHVDQPNKLLPLLIAGLNRAFPYVKGRTEGLLTEVEDLYKIVQTQKFSTALSVLRLLFQVHNASEGLSDRFYTAFYRRLLNVQSTQNDAQLFDLLFKVLKSDLAETRVRAFIKRMLQISLSSTTAFASAALLVTYALIKERPNLLGILPQKKEKFEADDDREDYKDVKENDGSDSEIDESPSGSAVKPGWIHIHRAKKKGGSSIAEKYSGGYDPTARNPLFSRADSSPFVELQTLARHYHPTVALFARSLVDGKPISYNGEPLVDFSAIRFLDRFAFKNPKTNKINQEESEDGAKVALQKLLFSNKYVPKGVRALNPSSQDYVSKQNSEIPLDERFLHRFATLKFKKSEDGKKKKKAKSKDDDEEDMDDVESINSDEFDTLLEKFEPGESNDVFDVDFAKEFGAEQTRKRKAGKGGDSDESVDEVDDDDDDDKDSEGDAIDDDEDMSSVGDDSSEEPFDDDEEDNVDDASNSSDGE